MFAYSKDAYFEIFRMPEYIESESSERRPAQGALPHQGR